LVVVARIQNFNNKIKQVGIKRKQTKWCIKQSSYPSGPRMKIDFIMMRSMERTAAAAAATARKFKKQH
jgi:hypothetical protein